MGALTCLWIVVILVGSGVVAEDCVRPDTEVLSAEARLTKDILCGYVIEYRPVKDHNTPVNVTVNLMVQYVSFNKMEEALTVHSWLFLMWKDEYLNWNPADYGGLTEVIVHSSKIWKPKLSLFNSEPNYYLGSFYTPCTVNATGFVKCVPEMTYTAICSSNLRNWPYDKQNCTLSLGSWMSKAEQVNFGGGNTSSVNYASATTGPGWQLQSVQHIRDAGVYLCCPNSTYPTLHYYFLLERHVSGPEALVVSPAVVVIIISLSCLLLDVRDNTRLALSCLSLFGHLLILAQIATSIPKHSLNAPILLLFLRDSLVLCTLGVLLTLLFRSLKRRSTKPHELVCKLTAFVSGRTGFAIYTAFEPGLLPQDLPDASDAETREAHARVWTDLCNILNTLSFVLILLVYLVLFTSYLPNDESTSL